MASRIAEAYVQIVPRIDGVAKGINSELSGSMNAAGAAGAAGFAGGFKKIIGPAMILAGAAALGNFAKEAFVAAQESKVANARIDQIAKQMGLFGKETDTVTKRLDEYSNTVMKQTGVDDESIKVIQAKLLTFKEIAKSADITGGAFDRATVAVLDLNAANLGGGNAAVALGKALNDPIKGITALNRSGVSFTAAERDKIKALTESGQILQAQRMILEAVETQVGGTAAATVTGTALMSTAYGEVKESIGALFEGPVDGLAKSFAEKVLFPLSEGITKVKEIFEVDGMAGVLEYLNGLRTQLSEALLNSLPGIIDAIVAFIPTLIQNSVTMITSLITAITNSLPAIIDGAILLFNGIIEALLQVLPQIIDAVVKAIPVIIDAIVKALPLIIAGAIQLFLGVIDGLLRALPQIVTALVNAIPQIIKAITDSLPLIIDGAVELFLGIIDGLLDALPQIIDAVIDAIPQIVDAILKAVPLFIEAGIELLKGLAKGIIDNIPRIIGTAIQGVGDFVIKTFKNLMGIKSPSTVFAGFGGDLMVGLAGGITDNASAPISELEDVNKKIRDLYNQYSPMFFRIGEGIVDGMVGGILNAGGDLPAALERLYKITGKALMQINNSGGLLFSPDEFFSVIYPGGIQGIDFERSPARNAAFQGVMDAAGFGVNQQGIIDALNDQVSFTKGNRIVSVGSANALDPTIRGQQIQDLLDAGFKQTRQVADRIKFFEEAAAATLGVNLQPIVDKAKPPKPRRKMAKGGFVTGPTNALIGEAGPEVVYPLDRFEQVMGIQENGSARVVNYYAAPNNSLDSERALLTAMKRAKVIVGW